MANKREQRRFIKRCEVEFTADNVTVRGISSDFSLTGLFIRTNHPLPPDTVFDMVIYLPDGTPLKLKGKTVRAAKMGTGRVIGTPVKSMKNGMGVEIIEKNADYLHFMRSLID
ncbi:MAG: PilZ domain-containing protein [Nitrospirae bacterium]|nr:PilZ domain-containing protein [Nitrospirota bacterium]